jgi:hypothetical protein
VPLYPTGSFARSARRPTVPRPVGGVPPAYSPSPARRGLYDFRRPSATQPAAITPAPWTPTLSDAQTEAIGRIRASDTPGWAKSQMERQVVEGIKSKYSRPLSVLGGIGRALGVTENVMVGLFSSVGKDISDLAAHPKNVPWAILSPWTYFTAHSPDNFKEIGSAVKDNRTYENWIAESQDPNSFLYKNKMVIGLGLSIAADPTTYLSFGTTGASKVAATRLLAIAAESTAQEAKIAKAAGFSARLNSDVSRYSYDQIFHAIHNEAGRPYTVGQAMDVIRQADRGKLPDLDPDLAEKVGLKVTGRGRVKGATRAAFARGGQGMRFMGAEIPGTRGLPGRVGAGLRRVAPGVTPAEGRTTEAALDFFGWAVPNEKLLRVSDDMTRAVAMSEMSRVNHARALARTGAYDEAVNLFRIDPVKASQARDQPALVRGAITVRNLLEDVPIAVPKNDRLDLLDLSKTPTGQYRNTLLDMRTKILSSKDSLLEDARNYGLSENSIKSLEKDWTQLNKTLRDPIDVMAWWSGVAEAKIATHKLLGSVLNNPLLARPFVSGEEDLARLIDEIADVQRRLEKANSRLREKGISDLARSRRLAVVKDLEAKSQELTAHANSVRKELSGAMGELPTAVRSETEFAATFGEEAIPMTYQGQKYLVPAAVANAIEEFKNPEYVTRELTKFFRAINYTQNKWKMAATVLNPSFHIMNAIGGSWNNLLGGVYNPGNYVQQYADMLRARMDQMDDASRMGRALGPVRGKIDPDKLERIRSIQEASDVRNVGGGFVSHDVDPSVRAFKKEAEPKGAVRKAITYARRGTAAGLVVGGIAPEDWVPDEIEDMPGFNPLIGLALGLPEFARAGKYAASDVEQVLRQTPMRVANRDPSYYQAMEAVSVLPPTDWGRWAGQTDIGKDQVMKEAVFDIGASMAIKYQFDYTALSTVERTLAKTIFPFYVFNKNNFVLQARELANRPRFVATAYDIGNFMNAMTETEQNDAFQELLPEYFDKLGMFRIPVPNQIRGVMGLPPDQDIYLNPKLPYASLNLFPAFWQLFQGDTITPDNTKMLQVLSPIFSSIGPMSVVPGMKPALEYSVGYNLGLARPIDYQMLESGGFRHSQREAPGWMHFVPGPLRDMFGVHKNPDTGILEMSAHTRYIVDAMATPFMNSAGDVFNWGGSGIESDRNKANNFAFITGIRLTPVDPIRLERGWLYRVQSYLEGQKGQAKLEGKKFPWEDELMLRRTRHQLKVIERAYDRRQKDLYGG